MDNNKTMEVNKQPNENITKVQENQEGAFAEVEKVEEVAQHTLVVETEPSGMVGYIKFVKGSETADNITKEQVLSELKANNIVYGIKETSIEKLCGRPIYSIRIEVARGDEAVSGQDGLIDFFVVKDSEYAPDIPEEGHINYKDLNYFQTVKSGQMLCAITKETEGTNGKNIMGQEICAKAGKPVFSPKGKNTSYNEDETILFADCDGLVKFNGKTIEINDTLRIKGDVDITTGHIDFVGDVVIEGDVSEGFNVTAGGNIIVKGVVEGAKIAAGGNVQIGNGINGGDMNTEVTVGGNLCCKYIETAKIYVEGNIISDYIIDSDVTCMTNINLTTGRAVLIGGKTKVKGELVAKYFGSQREKLTQIDIIGINTLDSDNLAALKNERDEITNNLQTMKQTVRRVRAALVGEENSMKNEMEIIANQIKLLEERLEVVTTEISTIQANWTVDFVGAVVCKAKMFRGVRISFEEVKFRFIEDSLDFCKIYWCDGQVLKGTL